MTASEASAGDEAVDCACAEKCLQIYCTVKKVFFSSTHLRGGPRKKNFFVYGPIKLKIADKM